MALPGVWVTPAQAEGAPDKGVIAFKYLYYEDSQPGLKRISVNAPSVYVMTPVGKSWAVEGTLVVDSLSGATPRWQTAVSSASVMSEQRVAGDVKVTRYFDRSSYSIGMSQSNEHDYVSTALALNGSWSTDDNNTTWNIGLATSDDTIVPTSGAANNIGKKKTKRGSELMVGLTQAMTKTDLVQVNVTFSAGQGYYDDPYKLLDTRPDRRKQAAMLTRWNHHFEGDGSTLRSGYRYYRDNYGIEAHTFLLDWAKPLGDALLLTPSMRYYNQSAASFYVQPQFDANGDIIIPVSAPAGISSGDQRLAAFGAFTVGLKADYRLTTDWSVDGKVEAFEQRTEWKSGDKAAKGLDPFRAASVQFGARYKF